MGFVHLHLHTQFSLLDGAIRLTDLFPLCKTMGFSHVAITDHGNLYGAVKFYEEAKKADIKAILGCEVYVAPGDRRLRVKGAAPTHLVLLARDQEGFANLSRMVSLSFLEGFYTKPRIDKELLRRYSRGLIGLSGCLSGEIPSLILENKTDLAYKSALEFKEIFEPESFYLELQKNGMAEQDQVNDELLNISEITKIPIVATNDCHYLRREDHIAHEVLICIQTGKKLDDARRMSFSTDQFYLKSIEEMYTQFSGLEVALENSQIIASRCNVDIPFGAVMLPRFETPGGTNAFDYLAETSAKGLAAYLDRLRRFGREVDEEAYRKRLEFELDVIKRMGFADYFLIVADFIWFARKNNIPVGPGRGSGAGSLVALCNGITQIDPLQFDLLFERFLNPERLDMPDFDVDFCQRKRDKVIEYVTQKYGKDRVGQIITYSSLNAKQAIRDVGRVLGFQPQELNKLTKLIPDEPRMATKSIAELMNELPRLSEAANADDKHRQLFGIAQSLEKLIRQTGVHAAGVVISREPLIDVAPLCIGKGGEVITQYAKEELEKIGLVKFDFLGLKTLTAIDDTLKLIRMNGKTPPDLEALPLDLPEVYRLISSGETAGVFQMESSGFRKLLRRLAPDCFEDIIAALALYRPGPLRGGMVDDYIKRKRGESRLEYPHKVLEPILKDTYGVIVYQEQVMRIATVIAGFTMSEADELRKAMAKKKKDKMAQLTKKFIAGGLKNGFTKEFLTRLMATLEEFGQYGFNKSHSAAYAYLSYWTAYLKAFFPVEFMAALLSLDKDKPEKMVANLAECKRMGVRVRVPDINRSRMDFSVVKDEIIFGLSGIKNVGEAAAEGIIQERYSRGPFKDLYDFCLRMDSRKVNRRVVEGLIHAGAFDTINPSRRQLIEELDKYIAMAQAEQKSRSMGQKLLFGMAGRAPASRKRSKGALFPLAMELMDSATLKAEKDAIGFYLSGHPMDRYYGLPGQLTTHSISELDSVPNGTPVTLAGVVSGLRERKEKGKKSFMGTFYLEDAGGMVEVVAFSQVYEPSRELLKGNDPVLVEGFLQVEKDADNESFSVKANKIESFSLVARKLLRRIDIAIRFDSGGDTTLKAVRSIIEEFKGEVPLMLELYIPGQGTARIKPSSEFSIRCDQDAFSSLSAVVGPDALRFHLNAPR